jgi:hypothetical protein
MILFMNMKKIMLILMAISLMLIMTACDDRCDNDNECSPSELCIFKANENKGICTKQECATECVSPDNVCSVPKCDRYTGFKCQMNLVETSVRGCQGDVDGKLCTMYKCSKGACIEETDSECLRIADMDKQVLDNGGEKKVCNDGTPVDECSEKTPGFFCYYGVLMQGDDFDCETSRKAAQIMPKLCDDGTALNQCSLETLGLWCDETGNLVESESCPTGLEPEPISNCSDGTLINSCSEIKEGYICNNGKLELDESCVPEIVECSDGTLLSECSTNTEGLLCNDEGDLVESETCAPEIELQQQEIVGCGDTPEGDCSDDGRWCVHGELIADDACVNGCDDGTPNWGCSLVSEGYLCEEGVLVEDSACNYVGQDESFDCDDGTINGFCNDAETHWCDYGELVLLEPGVTC